MPIHQGIKRPAFYSELLCALVFIMLTTAAQSAPFDPFHWNRGFYRYHWELPEYPRGAYRRHKQRANRTPAPVAKNLKGPLLIVVSIGRQKASVFENGTEIATTPISTGVHDHPTPLGVFSVIQKQLYHESNLYSAAPMPYMQRITWSGIALHAGVLPGHPASHGCIRMPRDFAVRLYAMTRIGARVIVTLGDPSPVEITHEALFQPKSPEENIPSSPIGAAALNTAAGLKAGEASQDEHSGSIDASAAFTLSSAARQPATQSTRHKGAVSVFISRKDGKLYVRDNLKPLLEVPIAITDSEKPIGTHVFTASELLEGGKRIHWDVVSIPSINSKRKLTRAGHDRDHRIDHTPQSDFARTPAAAEALDRINIPSDVRDRVVDLLGPGASLIISDNSLSDETGEDTDFIILTP